MEAFTALLSCFYRAKSSLTVTRNCSCQMSHSLFAILNAMLVNQAGTGNQGKSKSFCWAEKLLRKAVLFVHYLCTQKTTFFDEMWPEHWYCLHCRHSLKHTPSYSHRLWLATMVVISITYHHPNTRFSGISGNSKGHSWDVIHTGLLL